MRCEGDDWSFTSTPADTDLEDAEGNLIFEAAAPPPSNADPSDAGEYTLVIEAQSCLSEPTTFELVVTETIQAPLDTEPIEICEGSSLTLQPDAALADAVWEWTLPNGDAFAEETLFIASTAAADAGTYTLSSTNNGCPMVPTEVQVSLSSRTRGSDCSGIHV